MDEPWDLSELLARPVVTIDEAAWILGISRASAYKAVHEREIQSLKIGKRLLVLTAPLKQQLGL